MKTFKPFTTKSGTHHPFSPSAHGSIRFNFSAMVKDGISRHGIKWAVGFYRVKHGLTATEFRTFAGI